MLDEFVYLGAYVDKEGGGRSAVWNPLQKATNAFQRLTKVWSSGGIGRRTKIRLFKTGPAIWLRNLEGHKD